MSRTLTALFDNRGDAEAAKERLKAADVDVTHVHIHDQTSEGFSSQDYSSHENKGFWNKLTHVFLPEEDRHTYEEGVRRGGAILTADVSADQAETAARVLEQDSVDIDQRSGEWRNAGWQYAPTAAAAAATAPRRDTAVEDKATSIPLVAEELVVGKREVDRGTVRVRSYVAEVPVQEDVTLRDEHISVDRRPVDRALREGEQAFQERTIEATARGEEAVVGKEAHVREEVVLAKNASEHVETVKDTLRHTEVEIENDRAANPSDRRPV